MFEQPLIIVLIVLAIVGVAIGVFSLRRRSKMRALCAEASQAIEQGRHDEARNILLAAERSWSFNSHDSSRSSRLTDLNALMQILDLLARVPSPPASLARVESKLAELRALLSNRNNFGIDGRSMKRKAAVRWSELSDRFQERRQELRESYEAATSDG